MNYLKTYLNSFKNKRILLVLILNALFILATISLIELTKIASQPLTDKMNEIDLGNIMFQDESQLQQTVSTLRGFFILGILIAIAFTLLLIIIWSFFQGIIYKILLKQKFNIKFFRKFLLLNIIWFVPWLLLFFIVLSGSKIEYLAISSYTLLLLFLHFSFILYIFFPKNNKLGQIKESLKTGTLKMHHFIIPYLIILITFIIISQLNLLNIPYLMIFVYLLFFSWIQNYTTQIILNNKIPLVYDKGFRAT